MIVASALGDLGLETRIMPNGVRYEALMDRRIAYRQATATRAAAEVTRRAALTPGQRAAEDKVRAEQLAAAKFRAAILKELHSGKPEKGHGLTANKITTPAARALQAATLARDWDALFALTGPPKNWTHKGRNPVPNLAKYSFRENGVRRYVALTEDDLRRFIFSKHYLVQPGWVCTDAQRTAGVAAHWEKHRIHASRYPNTDWRHIWQGTRPGWGYPGSRPGRYMCEKYKPSRWVRIRKKVYVAAAIVAAVYLGPVVMSKVSGMLSSGSAGGTIVGAGAKAGAATAITTKAGITTLVATKAGTAAAIATKAGLAAKAAGFFTTVQKGIGLVNNARTVNAIISGDMPPPPIATGKNFTDWAMNIAKDEISKTQAEKLSELDEARMRAELAAIQREIDALVPAGTPIEPDPDLAPAVRDRIVEMQNIERQREGTNVGLVALAVGVPLAFMAVAG